MGSGIVAKGGAPDLVRVFLRWIWWRVVFEIPAGVMTE
jgi:hypothetical protein